MQGHSLTYNETLHLVLPQHVHAQRISNHVVELVSTPACRHDTQLTGLRAVEGKLLVTQVPHVLDAVDYAIRLEGVEVEPAAGVRRAELA